MLFEAARERFALRNAPDMNVSSRQIESDPAASQVQMTKTVFNQTHKPLLNPSARYYQFAHTVDRSGGWLEEAAKQRSFGESVNTL
jgi:hypothetical protein